MSARLFHKGRKLRQGMPFDTIFPPSLTQNYPFLIFVFPSLTEYDFTCELLQSILLRHSDSRLYF